MSTVKRLFTNPQTYILLAIAHTFVFFVLLNTLGDPHPSMLFPIVGFFCSVLAARGYSAQRKRDVK